LKTSILDGFFVKHDKLLPLREKVEQAISLTKESLADGGKILVCGNGGSAADAEHIVGELMKGFLRRRPVPLADAERLASVDEELGVYLATRLQEALPAIALTGQVALSTAVANDNGGDLPFAQQVWGYGRAGDVFLGISTSGNSRSVALAATAARARGMVVIGLTGAGGGKLGELADVCLNAPSAETFEVQEFHVALYHLFCAALEEHFYAE
jgi:D-sedoheptulose 7-phosphate isomerase